MGRKISEERKTAYYVGGFIQIIGGISFFSVFVSGCLNFGDFSNFESDTQSMMFRAIGGMALLIIGAVIRGVGAKGMAGSGVILDPEQAREDLEPYSRMTGGIIKDVLDEADINIGSSKDSNAEPEKIIMIKCLACGKLNEEDSKFCQECGQKI